MSSNIQALVNLNGHMNDLKWGQLRLFFHILEAGSSAEINKANDLLTFKNLLVPKFCNQALPVIHFMLSKIEVIGLDQLIVDQCTEQNRLEYPALLIYICKSLDTSKFNKLRVIASQPEYLKGNHDNIHSCEELMLRLHCHTLISPTNLKFIIDWLPRIGLQNIAGEVSKFRNVQAPAGVEPSAPQASQAQVDDTDSESDLSQKVDIVASKVGTTPRELKRRILEDDLQNIPMLEGWSEVFRMVLENSTLRDWYACKGESATYMVLAEKLVVAKKPKMVEQVCRMAKVPLYCSLSTMQESTVTMQIPEGSRPGEAPLENLWDSSSIKELKVYFMNPDVLQAENRQWLYGHNGLEPMSTQIILEWAIRGWKDARYEEYPRISPVAALKIDRSHIRVEFAEESNSNVCWSYIGKQAQNYPRERTMFLDLFNLHQQVQESLVIHEFGHALGLEHEHQRSKFWDTFETVIEDKDNLAGVLPYHARGNFTRGNFTSSDRPYDPHSIMHYWFDTRWLKKEYQDLNNVETNLSLSEEQKDVIRGVHIRDRSKGRLAKRPSIEDIKTLNEEYQKLTSLH